jgi:hypothetical protein
VFRRPLLIVLAVVALAGLAVPAALVIRHTRSAADMSKHKVIFGAYVQPIHGQSMPDAIRALEHDIGRTLAGIRVYDLWDDHFPDADERWMRDSGHALFLSVRAKTRAGQIVPFRDIGNAKPGSPLYQQMVAWARSIKGFHAHVYVTFNHEPESHSSESNGNGPEFVAAWRRFVGIFRDEHVANAEFVWVMTDYAFSRTDDRAAKYYYPGDAWVDDISEDVYNWNDCRPGNDSGWHSLKELADPMRRFGRQHPGKHLMFSEWGSIEDPARPGRKAAWISDAAATLQSSGWESFSAVLYFDSRHPDGWPKCNWRLDTSTSAMKAFRTMGADSYFGAG